MARKLKSDRDQNAPGDLKFKAGQSVEVKDDRVADELLQLDGFSEVFDSKEDEEKAQAEADRRDRESFPQQGGGIVPSEMPTPVHKQVPPDPGDKNVAPNRNVPADHSGLPQPEVVNVRQVSPDAQLTPEGDLADKGARKDDSKGSASDRK